MLVAFPAFAQHGHGGGHPGGGWHGPVGHPGPGWGHGPMHGPGWGHPGWHRGPVWGQGRDWNRGWDPHHYWGFGWYWVRPGVVVIWTPGVGYTDTNVFYDPNTGWYYYVDAFGVTHWLD
ncbi:MAG TPA: hypothetical protein V6D22_25885 [Candidatus Obscuribacterales bacterium]